MEVSESLSVIYHVYGDLHHKSAADCIGPQFPSLVNFLVITVVILVTKSCPTLLQPHGLQPAWDLCLWDFPGKNTGAGCHLLQEIFLTQGLNLGLLN